MTSNLLLPRRDALFSLVLGTLPMFAQRSFAAEPPPATVRIATPSTLLPVQVALAQGFFQADSLKVEFTQFAASRQAFRR